MVSTNYTLSFSTFVSYINIDDTNKGSKNIIYFFGDIISSTAPLPGLFPLTTTFDILATYSMSYLSI